MLKIAGLPVFAFIIICIVIIIVAAIIFYFWYINKKRLKHQLLSTGSIIAAIVNRQGDIDFLPRRVKRGIVKEFTAGSKKLKSNIYVADETGDNPTDYVTLPDHYKHIWWPIGLETRKNGIIYPHPTQVKMMMYLYNENDPCPKMPNNPENWYTGESKEVTNEIIQQSADEQYVKAVNKNWGEIVDKIESLLSKLKTISWAFYASCLAVILSGIGVALLIQLGNNVKLILGK